MIYEKITPSTFVSTGTAFPDSDGSHYRRFFETTSDGILIFDASSGEIKDVNPCLARLLGYARTDLLNKHLWEVASFASIASDESAFRDWQHKEFPLYGELWLWTGGGVPISVEGNSTVYTVDGKLWVHCTIRDISMQKIAVEALREQHRKFQAILNNVNEYIYSVEYKEGRTTSIYHSPQCQKITGYSAEDFYKDDLLWFRIVHKDDCEMVREYLRDLSAGKKRLPIQCRIIRKDGSERWIINSCAAQRDTIGKLSRLDGSIFDVSELSSSQESNAFLANYDALTRLPNRNLLYNRLEKALRLARRENKHVAVLFLDLDNFKLINDSRGHDAGDRVLTGMAKQLNGFVRAGDTVSRWGGDEFVVVLWDCGAEGAAFVAEKLTCSGFKVDGTDFPVSMSAGISVFPEDGENYETLLKNADTAMYQAKRSGRQSYEFFTPALNSRVRERFLLEGELRRALEQNEFSLYYQPRINIPTGKISGVEALLRWRNPSRGLLLPDDFLPVAEECGLIRRISEWVLLTACRQLCTWQREYPELPIAVNIAPSYFQVQEFEEVIRATLWETGLSPESLELELNENTILMDPDRAFIRLSAIKALGVRLSIDNFGTGYSSLAFLKKLPVDKLKIDGSFVQNLSQKEDGMDLIRSIISVGHNLKASVVAEGIETPAQFLLLQSEGCDEGQGFYFCRPVPEEEMTAMLSSNVSFPETAKTSVVLSKENLTIQARKESVKMKYSRTETSGL